MCLRPMTLALAVLLVAALSPGTGPKEGAELLPIACADKAPEDKAPEDKAPEDKGPEDKGPRREGKENRRRQPRCGTRPRRQKRSLRRSRQQGHRGGDPLVACPAATDGHARRRRPKDRSLRLRELEDVLRWKEGQALSSPRGCHRARALHTSQVRRQTPSTRSSGEGLTSLRTSTKSPHPSTTGRERATRGGLRRRRRVTSYR